MLIRRTDDTDDTKSNWTTYMQNRYFKMQIPTRFKSTAAHPWIYLGIEYCWHNNSISPKYSFKSAPTNVFSNFQSFQHEVGSYSLILCFMYADLFLNLKMRFPMPNSTEILRRYSLIHGSSCLSLTIRHNLEEWDWCQCRSGKFYSTNDQYACIGACITSI